MNVNLVFDHAGEEMQFSVAYFKPVTYFQLVPPTTFPSFIHV